MKFLISFVFLIPILFAAAPNAQAGEGLTGPRCRGDAYCREPLPFPIKCPEGTHAVYDRCVRDDDSRICPKGMSWWHGMCQYDRYEPNAGIDDRLKKMSGVLGGDDSAAKGAALNGFFDASLAGKSGDDKGAVYGGASAAHPLTRAGLWKPVHTDPSVPVPSTGKPRPTRRQGEARFITVGAIEDLGNKLRDRNDKKLEEATKQQKDTEKAWKDYKDGKTVSPHPTTAEEVTIGGKG